MIGKLFHMLTIRAEK